MPARRDGSETRDRLIRAGEHLFASESINAPLSSVLSAARQRNKAALQYYFGSRDGLLAAILERHVAVIEADRSEMLRDALALDRPPLGALVAALFVPAANRLHSPEGRDYLLILLQLVPRIDPTWGAGTMPPSLSGTLDAIEARLDAPRPEAHARTALVQVMQAGILAERARQVSSGESKLSHQRFVVVALDMLTNALGSTRGC
jgi:AcrR family transcriptional regulator